MSYNKQTVVQLMCVNSAVQSQTGLEAYVSCKKITKGFSAMYAKNEVWPLIDRNPM